MAGYQVNRMSSNIFTFMLPRRETGDVFNASRQFVDTSVIKEKIKEPSDNGAVSHSSPAESNVVH